MQTSKSSQVSQWQKVSPVFIQLYRLLQLHYTAPLMRIFSKIEWTLLASKAINDERRNRVCEKNLLGMAKLSNLFTVGKQWCRKRFFKTTYPLSINSKFSLKPEIGCKS